MSFRDLFGWRRSSGSAPVATERLKVVLEYDRAQLTPAELDQIRREIIELISRHVRVRRENVRVNLETGGRLVVDIPLDRARRSDG